MCICAASMVHERPLASVSAYSPETIKPLPSQNVQYTGGANPASHTCATNSASWSRKIGPQSSLVIVPLSESPRLLQSITIALVLHKEPRKIMWQNVFGHHAGLLARRRTISRIIASFRRVSLVWTLRS